MRCFDSKGLEEKRIGPRRWSAEQPVLSWDRFSTLEDTLSPDVNECGKDK
jgi:hypothetical protein